MSLVRNAVVPVVASLTTLLFLFPLIHSFGATQVQIGSTWYEKQHNGSIGRQIGIGEDGRIHFSWAHKPGPATSDVRTVYYNVYDHSSGLLFGSGATGGKQASGNGGGFTTLGMYGDRAVLAWNEPVSGTFYTHAAIDSVASMGVFSKVIAPIPNCSGTWTGATTENSYVWPVINVDQDGAGSPVVHIVACESQSTSGDVQSLVYYRASGTSLNFGTCGIFVDSVLGISPIVCSDPNSDRVALVYCQPIGMNVHSQNIVYIESTDLGLTWGARQNITRYTGKDYERGYAEVSGLYSLDGCLHIVWPTVYYDSTSLGFSLQKSKLRHWDACSQCQSLLLDANWVPTCGTAGDWKADIAKVCISECGGRIYCTYNLYGYPNIGDCASSSPNGIGLNAEIFLSASTDNGLSWGIPINLTNTQTPGCSSGNCLSEIDPSMPSYCNDSLHIMYVKDLDGGEAVDHMGSWTENPVMYMTYPCFVPAAEPLLTHEPDSLGYPFSVHPDSTHDTTFVLMNLGNAVVNYTRSVQYINGSGWIDFPDHPSPAGSVSNGCSYADTFKVRVHGINPQGVYRAAIHFAYSSGSGTDTNTIPITLFSFPPFCFPADLYIATSCNKLSVRESGQFAGGNQTHQKFTYFSDLSDYLYDASLILGNGAGNLSKTIYKDVIYDCGVQLPGPTGVFVSIPGSTVIDSTSNSSYSFFTTQAFNRDSTLQVQHDVYAPKHPDSCDFYIARYRIFKGINNPTGAVTGLTAAFAADWDVPSDTGNDNQGGFDASLQMIYQRGVYTTPNNQRYAAIAAYREGTGAPISGGFVWENDAHVSPSTGYNDADLWSKMQSSNGMQSTDSIENLNSVLVIGKNLTVNGAVHDTLKFMVILAGEQNGALSDLRATIQKARSFYCAHQACVYIDCFDCGDVNSDNVINISDAVSLIQYIFGGGPAPSPLCRGDANGDGTVNISDAVYIISYIFLGGAAPHCAG